MTSVTLANLERRPRTRARALCAAVLVLGLAALSGCGRRALVRDVHHHPAVLETGMNASRETTHAAVLRALGERGYVIESDDGRVVMARMSSGAKWARMRVVSGDGRYSITHADSSPEFRYDPERGTVHRRYNRWVKNLEGTIDDTLREMVEVPPARPAAVAATAPKAEPPRSSERPPARATSKPAPAAPSDAPEGDPELAPTSELPDRREPVSRPPGAIDI